MNWTVYRSIRESVRNELYVTLHNSVNIPLRNIVLDEMNKIIDAQGELGIEQEIKSKTENEDTL